MQLNGQENQSLGWNSLVAHHPPRVSFGSCCSCCPATVSKPICSYSRLPAHCWSSVQVLKGHDDHVITCLQFCGNRIVSGSDDNTLKVWSAVTGEVGGCPEPLQRCSAAAGGAVLLVCVAVGWVEVGEEWWFDGFVWSGKVQLGKGAGRSWGCRSSGERHLMVAISAGR